MRPFLRHTASERGAVLVHVALALIGLLGFSAFVIDAGVLWAARRQAQNAADAGAMAGAVSLGFIGTDEHNTARQSALDLARRNHVWGAEPDITPGDVTFPPCPPGSPGEGTDSCIRVDVFRNQRTNGKPLPTLFSNIVGVTSQGVRATATAQVEFSNTTDCVKPFAIPDKWLERRNDRGPAGWSEEDSFERYNLVTGAVLNPADYYEPPNAAGGMYAPYGTGFSRESTTLGGSDHGRRLVLKAGGPATAIAPGWYFPVVINPTEGPGGAIFRENIRTCDQTVVEPGTMLQLEPGNMLGPTMQGVRDLIAQDPSARWNPNLYGPGRGGVEGGCMAAGTCALSPRLVAIPLFDPDKYERGKRQGRITLEVVKVLGFFMDQMQGADVVGYISPYPSARRDNLDRPAESSFVVSFAMVR